MAKIAGIGDNPWAVSGLPGTGRVRCAVCGGAVSAVANAGWGLGRKSDNSIFRLENLQIHKAIFENLKYAYAHEIHAYEVHANEVHAREVHVP
jgi:hypothetical protein